MSLDTARALLADALQVDAAGLSDTVRLGEIEAWDSLGHMRLLTAIEERLGRPLEPEAAAAIESLADVAKALG